MEVRQSPYHEERQSLSHWLNNGKFWYTGDSFLGADSGFDGICKAQGACRGAVCLVKSRKKIVANDENYALAA
jgi:hypothetical protein